MKAILQRVTGAKVNIKEVEHATIEGGLLIFLGVVIGDTGEEAKWLAQKIASLRIFTDENDKMNLSLLDVQGGALVVSNFTLCANAKKGNRPSYKESATPKLAESLYLYFSEALENCGVNPVKQGVFGEDMAVSLTNDGPVTIVLDTDELMPGKGKGRAE